ncbi:MAG: hypothetical protein M3Y41_15590 [Pseudomonadota bacterium]|nr:hypothetical protein [Pseudomonadota bacterium]
MLEFVMRVLALEILTGAALYSCGAAIRAANFGAGLFVLILVLAWMMVLLWTRRFGFLRPRGWSKALLEGSLLYIGSLCCMNLLVIALNSPLWTAKP